ncbi:probable serine/threonine-protein kinase dyrk1 isoform X2 [Mytilus californianus]|uniref:probable serine/threonine-protein kinase dyrk1 isoform X2 n=1 Tax=Mytilus californianus TaxID=6549 RepID=UPI002245E9F4|nr:probable serine/threonine-protein kinase dyrk1 isoform X2 [Mytilus californianus]
MKAVVIFSCLFMTVCGMGIQKRNADLGEMNGDNDDFAIDSLMNYLRKRWSIGSGNKGDQNSASGNRNIDNTNTKKSKNTNAVGAGNKRNFARKRNLKICKKWSIGSNYKGDGNTADNNTNIDSISKNNKNKTTNEIGVGNFEHSKEKSDWSIGSNNEGNKNSANGNKNICNNQKHNYKNTNVFKAGNVRNNGRKRGWSYKRKRGTRKPYQRKHAIKG